MPQSPPKWTREQLDQAKEMWLAGNTATTVGKAVGKSVSAVIGKMKRLGMLHRPTQPVVAPKTARASPKPRPQMIWSVQASQGPIELKDLKPHHCRAILGDVSEGGFAMYCGDPKAEGSSYCPFHKGLYTQPLKERVAHGQAGQRK